MGSTSPIRSPTLVSGVASFSPNRSLRCSHPTGVASPCSAIWRCAHTEIGCCGCSLSSLPRSTGVHSSSRPMSVRIRRVLPWPRSPSRTMSWPASSARSTSGTTVSSKPTMPGRLGSPAARRLIRLWRISVLTERCTWPDARSSPSVAIRGWVTVRRYVGRATCRHRNCWAGHEAQVLVHPDEHLVVGRGGAGQVPGIPHRHAVVLSEDVEGLGPRDGGGAARQPVTVHHQVFDAPGAVRQFELAELTGVLVRVLG